MKKLAGVTLGFLLLFGPSLLVGALRLRESIPDTKPKENIITRAQESTVRVQAPDGTGSGFVIARKDVRTHQSRYFVWTARHVTQPNFPDLKVEKIIRWNQTNRVTYTYAAHTLVRLADTDAALLAVDAPPGAFAGVDVYTSEISVGDSIFVIGSPLGDFDGSVSVGILSQRDSHPTHVEGWPWALVDQTDARVLPGSSGGPVFERSGKVVGIIVGGPNQGMLGISHFVPLRAIRSDSVYSGIQWALYGNLCPDDAAISAAIIAVAKMDALLEASAKKAAEDNQPKAEPVKPGTGSVVNPPRPAHWWNRSH